MRRRALRNPIVDGKLDSWFGRLERAEERAEKLRGAGASDVRVVTKDRGRYEVYATMPANMTTRGRTRVKERKPRTERAAKPPRAATPRPTAAPVSAVEPTYIEVAPPPKPPKVKRAKPEQFALSFEQPLILAEAPAPRKRPKMERPPPRASVVDELDETFTSDDDDDDDDVMAGIKRRAAAKVEAKAAALAGRPEVDDTKVEKMIDLIERAVVSMQAAGRPNDTFTLAMSKAGALARKTSSPELRRAIADARKAAAALSGGGGARGFDTLDNPRGKRRRRRR